VRSPVQAIDDNSWIFFTVYQNPLFDYQASHLAFVEGPTPMVTAFNL
jgi:hypothetical protein